MPKDEISRFKVPLFNLRKEFPHIIISVDTYLSEVADMAISLGADMINDISGGTLDEKMTDLIIKNNIAYVLMHMKGNPQTMQKNPTYINVVNEINSFFKNKIQEFKDKGFDKLILDVGFGFGKTIEHNYILLKKINIFKIHGFPILAGLSRKSMINNVIHTNPSTALNGTTVLNTLALSNGANMLRVHDVTEAQQAIELWNFYQSIRISK